MKKRIAFMAMVLTIASTQIIFAESGMVNASASVGIVKKASSLISSSAIQAYGVKYGIVTTKSLNVRSGAGTKSKKLGAVKLGNKVTMYGKTKGFYKIKYKGKIGYINASYVKITGEKKIDSITPPEIVIVTPPTTVTPSLTVTKIPVVTPLPTVAPTPTIAQTPVVTPTSVPQFTGVGKINNKSLNVRSSAVKGNNVIGSVYPSRKVNIYGIKDNFYKIRYYGQWGYISKSFVSIVKGPLSEVQYIANGSQYTVEKSLDELIAYSNTFLGMAYLWGGKTPEKLDAAGKHLSGGFDCSGFILHIYKNMGVILPRTTAGQIDSGISVKIEDLQKGDIILFRMSSGFPFEVSHVGMYIGDNKFIHSSKPGDFVKISELTGYYLEKFIIGKRILKYK